MMETTLAVPLLVLQIDAANRLHQQLLQWQITDQALRSLHVRFPGFDMEATLLKVVAVNQLYRTQIYAVIPLARHIKEIMPHAGELDALDLVEQLAAFSGRKHLSFASKFAHFFIDMERFPIYDSFARKMLAYHMGIDEQALASYKAFVENIARVKKYAHLLCSNRELDRYLWLAGLYQAWQKNSGAKINVEIANLFKAPSSNMALELTQLSPSATSPFS